MKKTRKVYIQSPGGDNIRKIVLNELNHFHEKETQNVGYWNQFHIPLE